MDEGGIHEVRIILFSSFYCLFDIISHATSFVTFLVRARNQEEKKKVRSEPNVILTIFVSVCTGAILITGTLAIHQSKPKD